MTKNSSSGPRKIGADVKYYEWNREQTLWFLDMKEDTGDEKSHGWQGKRYVRAPVIVAENSWVGAILQGKQKQCRSVSLAVCLKPFSSQGFAWYALRIEMKGTKSTAQLSGSTSHKKTLQLSIFKNWVVILYLLGKWATCMMNYKYISPQFVICLLTLLMVIFTMSI